MSPERSPSGVSSVATGEQRNARWLMLAGYASVGVALTLILGKTLAWYLTDSASLLGSLLDSVMDSMASVITLLAVRYSLKPADADHRFGHGKAESLAAMAQAGFIVASALLLLVYCLRQLLDPAGHVVHRPQVGVLMTVVAILLTLGLVALQGRVIRMTGSAAIRADSLHYKSDLMMNLSVLAALLGSSFGLDMLDVFFGMGIAVFIGIGAGRIGWESFDMLMDRELPPAVDQEILALARANPAVLGVHDLRTRRSGHRCHIQLHLEFPDSITLRAAHRIADEVEQALLLRFPGADVIIHQDPQSEAPPRADAMPSGDHVAAGNGGTV